MNEGRVVLDQSEMAMLISLEEREKRLCLCPGGMNEDSSVNDFS